MNTEVKESKLIQIELYYERYLKSFDVVDDFNGMGPGTIIGGDIGYNDSYEEFIDRLKEDIESHFEQEEEEDTEPCVTFDVNEISYIKVNEDCLEVFIPEFSVTFN